MFKKAKIIIPLVLFSALLLSGCSIFNRGNSASQMPTKPIVVTDTKEMKENTLYVMHKEDNEKTTYSQFYKFDQNYKEKDRPSTANSKKTLWFHDDWEAVPTFYEGDKIVFKTKNVIPETFVFERFEYEGYTLGISRIRTNKNGRYFIDTYEGEEISKFSDAKRLLTYGSEETVIESVSEDGSKINRRNLARGGTITDPTSEEPGLEKDAEYHLTFYVGTKQRNMKIKADTIALTSMEVYSTRKSEYIDGDLMEIFIPEEFNSGYYAVGRGGIFRYVKGTTYDENTDFNIPNDFENEEPEEIETDENGKKVYGVKKSEDETGSSQYEFTVSTKEKTDIKVKYTDTNDQDLPDPIVKIIGDDAVRTMSKDARGTSFTGTFDLPIGDYIIEVTGLEGREVEFEVK